MLKKKKKLNEEKSLLHLQTSTSAEREKEKDSNGVLYKNKTPTFNKKGALLLQKMEDIKDLKNKEFK